MTTTADDIRAVLDQTHDMEPVHGHVDVRIPAATLWEFFRQAQLWPQWNRCFYRVRNADLVAGQRLVWAFQPIRPVYLYKMPAIADIVQVEAGHQVAWHVTALPGFFARHVYRLEDLGDGLTRFGSWEKAMGGGFRATRRFWLAHFLFVRDRSLEGARLLEQRYQETGRLDAADLPSRPLW